MCCLDHGPEADEEVTGGRAAGLEPGSPGRASSAEEAPRVEIEEFKTALGEAAIEVQVWKRSAEYRLGPSATSR